MANTVFALDIHDDLVTGVLVRPVAKSLEVTACGCADVGLQSVETAVAEVIAQVGYTTRGMVGSPVGAEYFYYRNFNFPFTDARKINKILPGELAENAPVEADRMVFDYLFASGKEREAGIITAMAEKSFLAGQLQFLQGQSCDPEIIGISGTFGANAISGLADVPEDYYYLDVGFRRAVLVVILAGKIAVMRPLVFDTALQAGFGTDGRRSRDLRCSAPRTSRPFSQPLSGLCGRRSRRQGSACGARISRCISPALS